MKIFLRDRNPHLVQAWKDVFGEFKDIHISCGDIFQEGEHLDVESIVSPSNSFCYMDGGIDYVYSNFFGWGIGDLLREKIWTEHDGELLVGQAVVVDMRETNSKYLAERNRTEKIPFLISAPTMRIPLNVSNTVNAFLAFRAALKAARKHGITSVLCPGLATAIGKMAPTVCAKQMLEAYKQFLNPTFYDVLGDAHAAHHAMLA